MSRMGDKLSLLSDLDVPEDVRKEFEETGMLYCFELAHEDSHLTDSNLQLAIKEKWNKDDHCFKVGERNLFFGIDFILKLPHHFSHGGDDVVEQETDLGNQFLLKCSG